MVVLPIHAEPTQVQSVWTIASLPAERQAMPIHDWTCVDAGLFHAFHYLWIGTLCDSLNAGGLPPGYFALLVIDLFPPSKRDPQGIHKAIWDEFVEEDFALPADKRLTLAAYDAGPPPVAYVEPVAVGDTLPEMPIFLKPGFYVPAPLEATYRITWD